MRMIRLAAAVALAAVFSTFPTRAAAQIVVGRRIDADAAAWGRPADEDRHRPDQGTACCRRYRQPGAARAGSALWPGRAAEVGRPPTTRAASSSRTSLPAPSRSTPPRADTSAVNYGQKRPFEPGKPIELVEGQSVDNADITLPKGSVISGRIMDEFGEPVADTQVSAMRSTWSNGKRRLQSTGRTATHQRSRAVPHLRLASRRLLRQRDAARHTGDGGDRDGRDGGPHASPSIGRMVRA